MIPRVPTRPSPSAPFVLSLLLVASLLTPLQAQAAGDAAAGRSFFSHCVACHSTSPGVNKIGPFLAGVVGSRSAAVPGFAFSRGMKNADVTWDEASLDKFLENPNGFVRGTKMFYRVSNPADRANVIAYLKTLKQ